MSPDRVAAPMRILALVLVAALLAGCTMPAAVRHFLNGDEVSAKDVRPDADAAAEAWNGDAVFAGAFAFESREAPYGLNPGAPLDPDVGNGLSVAWAFTYLAGGRMATFLVNATGDVVLTDDDEAPDEDFAAVGDDWVDSDDAVDAAREDQRVVDAITGAKAVGVALGDNGTSGPLWTVFTIGPSPIVAIVDARTGDLRDVHSFEMPYFGDWSGDWGGDRVGNWGKGNASMGGDEEILYADERSGTLQPVDGARETFDAPPGATRVLLDVSGTSVALPPDIDVRLLDAAGSEVEGEETDDHRYAYEIGLPGPYIVELRASQGATTVMYDLSIEVWGHDW